MLKMANSLSAAKLHVVKKVTRASIDPNDFRDTSLCSQTNMFATTRAGLFIFVYFPEVSEEEFRNVIEYARPGVVVDLRWSPRFDLGRLNRNLAFQMFERQRSCYIDAASAHSFAEPKLEFLLYSAGQALTSAHLPLDRPVVFLVDTDKGWHKIAGEVVALARFPSGTKTEIFEVPHYIQSGQ
jgi:hypothetical protein